MLREAVCVVGFFALVVSRPQETLKVDIPFEFFIGGQHLLPGSYSFVLSNQKAVIVRDSEGSVVALFESVRSNTRRYTEIGHLTFRQIDQRYFLKEMWWSGVGFGHVMIRRLPLLKSAPPLERALELPEPLFHISHDNAGSIT